MHPPSRARRILKWTGVGLSLIIVGTWVASLWFWAVVVLPGDRALLTFTPIGVALEIANHSISSVSLSSDVRRHDLLELVLGAPEIHRRNPIGGGTVLKVEVPFWLLLLLTAIPTAWLWHRDRRRIRPGCCLRCGYDLTGNTSGVCSECGEKKAMANSE